MHKQANLQKAIVYEKRPLAPSVVCKLLEQYQKSTV